TSSTVLDYSPDALARCAGEPEVVPFVGPFPDGLPVCVNCADTLRAGVYANANGLCVAQCLDTLGTTSADGSFTPNNPPKPADLAFCLGHARTSTNFPQRECFADGCTIAGTLRPDFVDPRRIPEPVAWQDLIGVTVSGSGT